MPHPMLKTKLLTKYNGKSFVSLGNKQKAMWALSCQSEALSASENEASVGESSMCLAIFLKDWIVP